MLFVQGDIQRHGNGSLVYQREDIEGTYILFFLSWKIVFNIRLQLLVQSVVQHDYIRGLNIGLKLVETIEDTPSRSFSDTADAFGLLLFPTVYDEIKWLPPPTHDQMPISVRRMTVAAEFAEQLLTDMVHDVESGETSIAIPSDTGGKHGRAPTNERPVIGVSERRKLLAGVINDQLNPAERKLRSLRGLSEDPAVLLRMLRMEM